MKITYCANGCTRTINNQRIQITTDPPSQLCRNCEQNLHEWLTELPLLYVLLPLFATPGTVERNPESQTTRQPEAAAPTRLDVVDLLDTRRGRKWNGSAPAHDRRGILGLLLVQAERVIEERALTVDLGDPPAFTRVCSLLERHRLWIAEQDWVKLCHDDIKAAHKACKNGNGIYDRPPVGRCPIDTDDDKTCDGPLFANKNGGVRCARCHTTWDAAHLRLLGLAQATTQEPTSETA